MGSCVQHENSGESIKRRSISPGTRLCCHFKRHVRVGSYCESAFVKAADFLRYFAKCWQSAAFRALKLQCLANGWFEEYTMY